MGLSIQSGARYFGWPAREACRLVWARSLDLVELAATTAKVETF